MSQQVECTDFPIRIAEAMSKPNSWLFFYFPRGLCYIPPMKPETIERIRKFTSDRDWDQFHSPANLAKSICIESAELLECFQWDEEHFDLEAVKEELADVMVYCRNLLDKLGLDEDEIINAKMDKNEVKYPIEKAKGKNTKYDKL